MDSALYESLGVGLILHSWFFELPLKWYQRCQDGPTSVPRACIAFIWIESGFFIQGVR